MLRMKDDRLRFKVILTVVFIACTYILLRISKGSKLVSEQQQYMLTEPLGRYGYLSHNNSYDRNFQKMVDLYRKQAAQRRLYLEYIKERRPVEKYARLYNILVPEVYCPFLVRVGRTVDGGKWICNPFQIPKDSVVFSLGISGDISFESELQDITARCCYIYAYDVIEQSEELKKQLKEMRGISKATKIGGKVYEQNNEYTIEHLMKQENVQSIEILKVDIEGDELTALPVFLEKHHPAQIMVEIHSSAIGMTELVQYIAKQGYWLFSHEINGAHHNLCEFSFIHVSAFERYSVTALARYLN